MTSQPETTERISGDRTARLLHELCLLVSERRPAEEEIVSRYRAAARAAEAGRERAEREIPERYEEARRAAEAEHATIRRQIVTRFENEHKATDREYQRVSGESIGQFETKKAAAERRREEAQWEPAAVLEAVKTGSLSELGELQDRISARRHELADIDREAQELLERRQQWREYPEPEVSIGPSEAGPVAQLDQLAALAKEQLEALKALSLPRLFEGGQYLGYCFLVWAAFVAPTAIIAGPSNWPWILASACVGFAVCAGGAGWLYGVARRQTTEAYMPLKQTLAAVGVVEARAREAAKAAYDRRIAEATEKCEIEVREAGVRYERSLAEWEAQKTRELQEADEQYPARFADIAARRDREHESAKKAHAARMEEIDRRYEEEKERAEEEFALAVAENDRRHEEDWKGLARTWRSGIERFRTTIDEIHRQCDRWFPDWGSTDWSSREPPAETPPAFRIGYYAVGLDRIEGGLPDNERLRVPETQFHLPALLPFPDRSLLLVQTRGGGGERGIELVQSAMLRMLTSMPPGKVRFTIIDPVGLGENFSAFMHLSDYEEQLVTSRIWTDPTHIEQRLTDLAEHMENVIQVYLRNEFETILEYNDFAGEMAEPYRVLVVADFPAGFTQTAAQKLKSIVTSGARCGVFTLLTMDGSRSNSRTLDPADLAPHALSLAWRGGRFVAEHPSYGLLPLVFDEPPETDRFTEVVRSVGSRVQDVGRVEVPFESVAPEEDRWWSGDSRGGLDVALGRAGARKLQHLSLGKGTSHHVLVAGKTGSGKSNLMHALIVNLALRYGPDELDLYLIDFKKGVEFKAYAGGQLPHARVVAIESEREFGLSVLARLDDELKRRGDMFRQSGVQDLKAYRSGNSEARLPRIVLVVDEFQELFVEDDRLAQDAALHLDRLVRQGRAFGIHVLLGSQTLSGAYSLARSTIGQMAVRIALQCSESDAHLILSEENTAARLLTRPGEAIYNDANGLYEGNHPFQIVWLPDHQRDDYLRRVDQLAKSRGVKAARPIVFEGNVPADPSQNSLLADLLEADSWPESSLSSRAWLGAPVAIKSPTAAEFIRQGASNLLVVGHHEEAALGVLATSMIGLAAQHAPAGEGSRAAGARFYVLSGTRPDGAGAALWRRLAELLPHEVRVVEPRGTPAAVEEVARELARRREADETSAAAIYLIVTHLSRFRDLRKGEDDFGFSSLGEEKPPSPADQFAEILREGPEFGIHSTLWCDTYNNVTRVIDRQGMRDLELRVLFQMNASDSSNLIDSPAAGRLGVHRAIFYDEGQGRLEKFRPYGVPSEAWLRHVGEQFERRRGRTS